MTTNKTFLACVSALTLSAGVAVADPVTVGMITTLSGGGAGLGVDVRDGFELALQMAHTDAIRLVVEDDGQRPEQAVQIADRMIQSEGADILTGIIWSNLAMAVVPAVTAQDVIYISPNAGPSPLAGAMCNENYFNVAWQNDMLHEAAGAYANTLGYTNTFILAPNYPAGTDALTGFKRRYAGSLAGEVYTQLGQTDYAAEIAQIKATDADVVFFFLPGGMGISFIKQYAGSGADKPLMGPAFSFDQGILGAVGEAALGVKNTSHWSKDLDNAANKAFVEAFQAEYGRLPSLYASQGYDTAQLLLSAKGKANVSDADAFRTALEAADFASTRGDFKFAANHHPIQTIYMREVVKEGDVVTNRIVGPAIENHQDPHGAECKM